MKYLSDYMQEAQTQLFKETGTFFAFSQKQFEEGKTEGKIYVNLGAGMFCIKGNENKLSEGLESIYKAAINQDLAENGKLAIIKRELANHEVCITWDITDTAAALDGYGFTDEEIIQVFRQEVKDGSYNDC